MYLVVADASPIHYLVLIDADQYLEQLYGQILIPETVAKELLADRAPDKVRNWMQNPSLWVQLVPVTPAIPSDVIGTPLDADEHDVLLLAMQLRSDLVLMDERAGTEEARRLGLEVIGTLAYSPDAPSAVGSICTRH
jgi:predicted nucleic acid-binding protein